MEGLEITYREVITSLHVIIQLINENTNGLIGCTW